jgi:hypothetical protein
VGVGNMQRRHLCDPIRGARHGDAHRVSIW